MNLIVPFIILFVHWVIWSGLFDAFHLSLGVISCGLVLLMSKNLMFQRDSFADLPKECIKFLTYLCWLYWQTIQSNIHVLKIVFAHDMYDKINPKVVRFKSFLQKDSSLVTFANSITLTPGTVTIIIRDGIYYVHSIDEAVAESLPGDMEIKCGEIFDERKG